ncbi:MAG: ATP-binding cassette domain-containing protein [Bacteroidota bacterium]|nr:ATP-binding cassette domain-containing protein [Bacteroidota bacterium]
MTKADTARHETLLRVTDLKVHFPIRRGLFGRVGGVVKAVDGVSFVIGAAEIFGVVGESGCGKSTVGNAVLRMVEPTSGSVEFDGQVMDSRDIDGLRRIRRHMQIIFQDPVSSLNPKMTVGESVGEPLYVHQNARGAELQERVKALFETVGLQSEYISRFPHEFSGGQRQRLVIARALALRPQLVVCDEPVSALDVSVQSQILNLLVDLQQEMRMAYLFISHDLSVIHHICDRVAVFYLGKIVETAATKALFDSPLHPYTEALMSAIPLPDPVLQRQRRRRILTGELPSPANPPRGCAFHSRCPEAQHVCSAQGPLLEEKETGHWVACHFRT